MSETVDVQCIHDSVGSGCRLPARTKPAITVADSQSSRRDNRPQLPLVELVVAPVTAGRKQNRLMDCRRQSQPLL